MTVDAALNAMLRLLLPIAALVLGALAVTALLDRMALSDKAAEQRALKQRDADLTARALAPGSALACLNGGAGETVETACEKAVFANAETAAAAVAYTAARLTLLKDVAATQDAGLAAAFAASRRALELDRFGLTAHVLAEREGCTVDLCPAFAVLRDTTVVQANLKAQAYDTYVARYAAAWGKSDPKDALKQAPVAEAPPPAAAPGPAVASAPEPTAGHMPMSSKFDFPSAASIPPVSIMNAEPPPPKHAEAGKDAAKDKAEADAVPVPQRRPQAQAAPPAAAR